MTCSDKIAKWNALGVQGGLLVALGVPRLSMASVTVGRKASLPHLRRALCCRLDSAGGGGALRLGSASFLRGDAEGANDDTWTAVNHPAILVTSEKLDLAAIDTAPSKRSDDGGVDLKTRTGDEQVRVGADFSEKRCLCWSLPDEFESTDLCPAMGTWQGGQGRHGGELQVIDGGTGLRLLSPLGHKEGSSSCCRAALLASFLDITALGSERPCPPKRQSSFSSSSSSSLQQQQQQLWAQVADESAVRRNGPLTLGVREYAQLKASGLGAVYQARKVRLTASTGPLADWMPRWPNPNP